MVQFKEMIFSTMRIHVVISREILYLYERVYRLKKIRLRVCGKLVISSHTRFISYTVSLSLSLSHFLKNQFQIVE